MLVYNVFILASFPLAALAGYGLALRLLAERWAAGFVALAFAFSPYHLAHARQHLDQAPVHWVAIVAGAVVGLTERPSRRRAALAALAFAGAVISNNYYAYLLGVLVVVLSLSWITVARARRAAWRRWGVLGAVSPIAAVGWENAHAPGL